MNFEMLGKLSIGKENEKFKPYSETKFDSGWVRKQIMFNAICGDNRHMLTVQAGAFADGHGDVYVFTKGGVDDDGNKIKGEMKKIPFKERLTSKIIPEVVDYRKFVVDTEIPGRRYKLKSMLDKMKEGTSPTDEELAAVGLTDESEVKDAYEKSLKKHREFISEWDFVDCIKKLLDSDKYKNKKFKVRGVGEYSYSDKNERVYESYKPTRIYLAEDNAEEYGVANIKFLFNNESLDDMSVEEKDKYYVNGYMMEYDSNRKGNIPVPTTIVFSAANNGDAKAKKFAKRLAEKFTVEGETYKELGIDVAMINGAQKVEIDESMLTEEQKEDLECGLLTMDDIKKDMGGNVYGDRVRELRFKKIGRGYTKGVQDTVYGPDDMVVKTLIEEAEEEDGSLFEDDDEI